jgi:hypothetical protein
MPDWRGVSLLREVSVDPIAFTTETGSTYVVAFRSDGTGIDVVRISDHPVRWSESGADTSFVRRYTSLEFTAGPDGFHVQFKDARDPGATFVTSPIRQLIPVRR